MAVPYIINSRGEQEPFSVKKVYRSARRVGASAKLAQRITEEVSQLVYTGISTKDIFKEVRQRLHQETPMAAVRFNLKEAMKMLGPTGFPFEKYISNVFKHWGHKVKINQLFSGKCCSGYEIDFTAEKDGVLKIGECKYHHINQGPVQIEVALANYARFWDIKNRFDSLEHLSGAKEICSILVTNARFSSRAIQYSECLGVELLGWNYPKGKGLEYFIDSQNLYPVTILPSFKKEWGDVFAAAGLMLAKDLLTNDIKSLNRQLRLPLNQLHFLASQAAALIPEV